MYMYMYMYGMVMVMVMVMVWYGMYVCIYPYIYMYVYTQMFFPDKTPPLVIFPFRQVWWPEETELPFWVPYQFWRNMGVSQNSVPLNPMVNDHYPY